MVHGSRPVGGGSGDIAALHSGKVHEISGTYIGKVAGVLSKQSQQVQDTNQNSLKTIEVI